MSWIHIRPKINKPVLPQGKHKNNYANKGYIKDIYIELPFYKYLHGPVEVSDDDRDIRFIGRKKIRQRLLNILRKGKKSGAYLVTGYRGMGKTSYVNKVLKDYQNEEKNCRIINVSLNQENLKLKDVYRQILGALKKELYVRLLDYVDSRLLYSLIFVLMLVVLWAKDQTTITKLFKDNFFESSLAYILIVSISSYILYQLIRPLLRLFCPQIMLLRQINDLLKRSSAEVVQEVGLQAAGNRFPLGFVDRSTNRFPIATTKEVEQELIHIISLCNQRLKKRLIFVFDELDKIENYGIESDPYEELDSFSSEGRKFDTIYQKDRKGLIIEILGALKHFITRAPARFIFIAGREMFDAALADINDRQSSISSIFHQIINVDSFLRDKSYNNTKGITNLIEEYLKEILLPSKNYQVVLSKKQSKDNALLKLYHDLLANYPEDERHKIIFALQNLMIYLTYRSNGAPHKLNSLVEELIFDYPTDESWKYILVNKEQLKHHDYVFYPEEKSKKKLFLKLSYSNQYRHSFICYIYRPFILTYSHYLKQYSDHVLYSTPYLMDHLIKFHPFAFSMQSLELLPEFLSSNRQPINRFFIEELVAFLRQNLLREVELGLFEYKYFKKVINEIEFISKTFESDSAAFNFTLDENYNIKIQIRRRIKELRSIHKEFIRKVENENVYSISYLNILLGDAHYFDQEFNESIVAYQDAIHNLKAIEPAKQSIEIFILTVRGNLKLGLAFEKIKSYDYAIAHYSEAVNISKKFFNYWDNESTEKEDFSSPSLFSELLQLCVQGFLAKLYVQEKLSIEGATINKVMYLQKAFSELITISRKITKRRNKLILSNFHRNVGTLFFYKNSSYSKVGLKPFYDDKVLMPINDYREELLPELQQAYGDNFNLLNFSPYAYISYKVGLTNLLRCSPRPLTEALIRAADLIQKNYDIKKPTEQSSKLNFSKVELKSIGATLSKIGDIILSYLPVYRYATDKQYQQYPIKEVFGIEFSEYTDVGAEAIAKQLLKFDPEEPMLHIRYLCKIFYLSAQFYQEAEISVSASFQLRKILHVIRLAVKIEKNEASTKFLKVLQTLLLSRILSITSWNSNSSDRPQIDKFKYFFGETGFYHSPSITKHIYKNISNSPETKEALLFYSAISIRNWQFPDFAEYENIQEFDRIVFKELRPYFAEQSLITHCSNISSQFTRILELAFQETINTIFLKEYIEASLIKKRLDFVDKWSKKTFYDYKSAPPEDRFDILKKEIPLFKFVFDSTQSITDREIVQLLVKRYAQLICNSIFSLTEVIRIINICGVKYMLSYSFLANFHRRLGEWLKHYALCEEMNKHRVLDFEVKKELTSLIGADSIRTLDPTSQFQLALQNYKRAIQLHTQGKTYDKQIENMIYLEDDFNDNLYHYCAAIERQQINSGRVNYYIEKLNSEIERSQLLKVDRYLNKE